MNSEDDWWDRLYADETEAPTKDHGLARRFLRKRPRPDAGDEPEPTAAPASAGRQAVDEDGPDTEPQPAPQRPRPGKTQPPRGARSSQAPARAQHPATTDPRRSLIEAWDTVPYRVRRLIANGSAAGLGWSLGLVAFTEDICGWVHTHGPADAQSIFWFCVGAACLALRWRARAQSPPVAWLASVPAASAVLGVLLYAPTT